ncbi:MAG TPA: hypothetical protein GX713_04325 [Mollicutes bacterium]|nr:hypothetical protein [Mollicutes bacterium]
MKLDIVNNLHYFSGKKDKNKNYDVDYFLNNIERNITNLYPYLDDMIIKGMDILIENNGYLESDGFPIKAAMFFHEFHLAYISNTDEKIVIHCPDEVLKVFTKLRKTSKPNETFNHVNDFVAGMMSVYQLVPTSILHEMYITNYKKINYKKFEQIMLTYSLIENYYVVTADEEGTLYCTTKISEKDIFENLNTDYEYRIFTKEEIDMLIDNTYIYSLDSTKKFIEFLEEEFEVDDGFIERFLNYEVSNYIGLLEDGENADNFLKNVIDELFEEDEDLYKQIKFYLDKIYKEYPKREFNGHVK